MGETEEDQVAEVEWKKQVEAWLCKKWTAEQIAQVAQVESSKQVTQDFAQAALAYWRSRGTAPHLFSHMYSCPIGTNHHISTSASSAGFIALMF